MGGNKFELFISHVAEDKKEVADPLNAALGEAGFKVWYSGSHLGVGESLYESIIERAIPNTRYCIVIFSHEYLESDWGRSELEAFRKKWKLSNKKSKKVFLPVLHKISAEEVRAIYPDVMNHYAVSTKNGIPEVTYKIIKSIKREEKPFIFYVILLLLLVASQFLGIRYYYNRMNDDKLREQLKTQVVHRMENFQNQVIATHMEELKNFHTESISTDSLNARYKIFIGKTNRERNLFQFTNGYEKISGKKRLGAMGLPVSSSAPYAAFNFTTSKAYLLTGGKRSFGYVFFNGQDPQVRIDNMIQYGDSLVYLVVSYTEPLRYVKTEMCYKKRIRHITTTYMGFKPIEGYKFRAIHGGWALIGVN